MADFIDEYEAVTNALAQQKPRYYDRNPWLAASQGVAQGSYVNEYDDDWEQLLIPILQGFTAGAFRGYGERNVENEYQDDYDRIADAYGRSQRDETDFIDELRDDRDLSLYVPDAQFARQKRERQQRDFTDELEREIAKTRAGKPGFRGGETITVNQTPDGLEYTLDAQGRSVPTEPAGASQGEPFDFGTDTQSLKSQYDQRLNELMQQGVPPGEAAEQASAYFKGLQTAYTKSFDKADKVRDKASTLKEIADRAEAAIEGAGYTGPFGGAAAFGSALVSPFSEEQAQKSQATGLLASVAPEIVKMSRSPGAVSDYETKLYLGAGPSRTNTPETNRLLAARIRTIAEMEADYADFLDTYKALKGTVEHADRAWQSYKSAFPAFVKTPDGIEVNKNRPHWTQFFSARQPQVELPDGGLSNPGSANGQTAVPPGMILQRNKRTGETRLVPK